MKFGIFLFGLILLVIGALYLLPIFGISIIELPNFGIEPLYIGSGLAGLGIILMIAGIKII